VPRVGRPPRRRFSLHPWTIPANECLAVRTKGSLSPTTARLMVFKLLCAASDLAATQRYKSLAEGHRGCQISRRHRGHPSAGKPRRLIASSPKIPHSSGLVDASSLAEAKTVGKQVAKEPISA
jgi:hypothetical protein